MECLECGGKTKVINVAKDIGEILRLRECTVCKSRFYTAEKDIDYNEGKTAINQIRNHKRYKRGRKQ